MLLSRPRWTRICSIASWVAEGPAKYAAGSPGSARVRRKVTTITPTMFGIAPARRLPIILSMSFLLRPQADVRRHHAPAGGCAHPGLHLATVPPGLEAPVFAARGGEVAAVGRDHPAH